MSFCNPVSRWSRSRTFKDDINNDYGIYPENGDDVMMEVVDKNTEYEHQAAGGGVETNGRQISDYDSMYDKMEETYDNMYN